MSKILLVRETAPTDAPETGAIFFWWGTDGVPHYMLDDGVERLFGGGSVEDHEAAVNPHPQYLTDAEANALYDIIGAGTSAVAAHELAVDPHPQYLTDAEADATYAKIDQETTGIRTYPGISYNISDIIVDGTGVYVVHTTPDFTGPMQVLTGLSATLTVPNDQLTYFVYAQWTVGGGEILLSSDINILQRGDVAVIAAVIRADNKFHTVKASELANGLAERLNAMSVINFGFMISSGCGISVVGTRNLQVDAGSIWYGASTVSVNAVDTSGSDTFFFLTWNGVEWDISHIAQLDNTQYNDNTGLHTLSNGRYAVNWIYRGVEEQKHVYVLLGAGNYTETQALDSAHPTPPTWVTSHATLVGRIIFQKNSNTPAYVQTVSDLIPDTTSGIVRHNDTTGKQGGTTNEYYHLTAAEHADLTSHISAVDPHPQYLTQAEGDGFYDALGAASAAVAAHELAADPHPQYSEQSDITDAIANHEGATDPHPQYLTDAEADLAYDPFGSSTAAVAAHELAADPHPQYLTQAEGDGFYELTGSIATAILDHESATDPHVQYLKEVDAAATYAEIDHIHATGNLLTVSKTPQPNEYPSLAAALAAIGTTLPAASTSNRYVIKVGPGEYTEPAGTTIPGFVYVTGHDPWNSAVLMTNNNSADFLVVQPNGGLFNIAVAGPTGAGWSAIVGNGNGVIKLYWVNLKAGYYGVTLAPTSGVARCHAIGVVTDGATMNRMFNCDGGTFAGAAGVFILMQSGSMVTTWTGTDPHVVHLVGNGASPPKAAATLDLCQFRGNAPTGQALTDVYADNGALVRGISVSFAGATSLTNPRYAIVSGSTPGTTYKTAIHIHGSQIKAGGYTKDIRILNTETETSYSGVATEANLDFVAGANFIGSFADPTFGQVIYGELYIGNAEVKTPLASYIQADKNTGLVTGGGLSRGAGTREVDVAAGQAFIDTPSGLVQVSWTGTTLTIPANSPSVIIYVDNTGTVLSSLVPIDRTLNAHLGEVGTDATDITYIFDQTIVLPHFRTRLYEYLERVIGPINTEGGIVTVNGTNTLGIDVTDSVFYVTEEEQVTVGDTEITFAYWYRDGLGEWIVVPSLTSVDPSLYDDGTGTLASVPTGKFKRDLLFVSKNTGGTEYHIVYGQEVFDTAIEAVNNPTPPDTFLEHACRLAAIVQQEGVTTIDSILDQRPRLGQSASATTTITNHNDLVGRDSATAHTQYQLLTEKNAANGYAGLTALSKIASAQLDITSNAPQDVTTAAPSAGVSTELARSDHSHRVTTGTPVAVGSANNAGVASTLARSDHIHAHGDQAGGTLHAVATTSVDGFMSAADKTKLDNTTYAIFEWGNSGIQTSTADRFMSPGWISAVAGTTNTFQIRCTRAGTLRNLYVYANTAGAGANTVSYVVQINGADTSLVATALPTVQSSQNIVNTVAVAAGDRISIKVTKAGTITTSPTNVFVTLELGA